MDLSLTQSLGLGNLSICVVVGQWVTRAVGQTVCCYCSGHPSVLQDEVHRRFPHLSVGREMLEKCFCRHPFFLRLWQSFSECHIVAMTGEGGGVLNSTSYLLHPNFHIVTLTMRDDGMNTVSLLVHVGAAGGEEKGLPQHLSSNVL